jgi:hypothetical protein
LTPGPTQQTAFRLGCTPQRQVQRTTVKERFFRADDAALPKTLCVGAPIVYYAPTLTIEGATCGFTWRLGLYLARRDEGRVG